MKTANPCLRRDLADIKPWTETCGQIRPLIEEQDGAVAEVHHLEITEARLHYHERTDEVYYVIEGEGRMRLDDEEIELHSGVTVYVPRGVKHKAWDRLKVLVVCMAEALRLWRAQNYFGDLYRRWKARLGGPKAITPMAHT